MGCCQSCLKGYISIPDNERDLPVKINSLTTPEVVEMKSVEINGFQAFPSSFNPTTSNTSGNNEVYDGTLVELKYSSKYSYDRKYLWLNSATCTINMSKYFVKERSHKEASLKDVTSVIAGPPVRYKPELAENISSESKLERPWNPKQCLSINFSKGGGIDVRFDSEEQRNVWFKELNDVVLRQLAEKDPSESTL